MATPLKIKVDFDNETTKSLLGFIEETQEGRYTNQKPNLVQAQYKHLLIQEQDTLHHFEDNNDEVLLFGVSY